MRQWIERSTAPLLYLTGRSGTGKSSLLNAWVLPELRNAEPPFRTVLLRSFADPVTALQNAVSQPGAIWERGRPRGEDPRILLKKACVHLKPERLLVVLDQFEEFVILHDDRSRSQMAGLLASLTEQPMPGLTLLAVLRSDYIGALHKLRLPRFREEDNWFEIVAFGRAEARRFLEQSGIGKSFVGDALNEAAEIEDNPGLIRPITLNMLGIVLQRYGSGMPKGLAPGTLIRGYVREAIGEPDIAEHAPPVLAKMISDAGTKLPKSEVELAASTKLDEAIVRGCLVRLGRKGLVREIDQSKRIWEVSHDFVARLVGQLVLRLRPSWLKRAQPWFAWTALGVWLVGLLAAYPIYQELQYQRSRQTLGDAGFLVSRLTDGAHKLDYSDARDGAFDDLWTHLERLERIVELDLRGDEALTRLDLTQLGQLQSLAISGNSALASVAGLEGLSQLQSLVLYDNDALTSVAGLEGLSQLQSLVIHDNDSLSGIAGLERLSRLRTLVIYDNAALTSVAGLGGLSQLQNLAISDNAALASVAGLGGWLSCMAS